MTTIIGLDLSLTSTGLARICGPVVDTTTVSTTGKLKDSLTQRWNRQRGIVSEVLEWALPADLVVVEHLFTPRTGSPLDRCSTWWGVVGALLDRDVEVIEVQNAKCKKWATGKGKADKATIGAAMARMWPDVECSNSDEADALALASMGAHMLGMLPDQPVYRTDVIGGMPSIAA